MVREGRKIAWKLCSAIILRLRQIQAYGRKMMWILDVSSFSNLQSVPRLIFACWISWKSNEEDVIFHVKLLLIDLDDKFLFCSAHNYFFFPTLESQQASLNYTEPTWQHNDVFENWKACHRRVLIFAAFAKLGESRQDNRWDFWGAFAELQPTASQCYSSAEGHLQLHSLH